MTQETKLWKINKLRTEIAFAYSDMAMGGLDKTEKIQEMLLQIKELEAEIVEN
jgi:endonuclease V-like protein UPF0215 family